MPTHEPSNQEILSSVQTIASSVQTLAQALDRVAQDVGVLKKDVGVLKDANKKLNNKLTTTNKKLDGVKETVDFLKENAAMRFEVTDLRDDLKRDIRATAAALRNEIIDHVDHFVHLHKKQEVEHLALVSRMSRHEQSPHHS